MTEPVEHRVCRERTDEEQSAMVSAAARDFGRRLADATLTAADELEAMLRKVHERDVDAYHRKMSGRECDICGCRKGRT